jgi:hypothetical protein
MERLCTDLFYAFYKSTSDTGIFCLVAALGKTKILES